MNWPLRVFPLFFAFALAGLPHDSAQGRNLSAKDLRQYGYLGRYAGKIEARTGMWNGVSFAETGTQGSGSEEITVAPRALVTGPSGQNTFTLTRVSARGNVRRATIRHLYSGTSFNPEYGEEMSGGGQKILRLQRRGFSRSQLEMTMVDTFEERSVFDGSLCTYWRRSGNLSGR
ncbi:MAG: hypothetical protein JNJ70_08315 [Verrucomicrobiales bacterium]|nr:hypothetical protein [Verrucomicrobiales bacterium]